MHADNREKVAREAAEAGGEPPPPAVTLIPIPLFHVFGFMMALRSVAMGETAVLMERYDFIAALRAIERYRVTLLPAAPPVLVAMVKYEEARRRDLSSLLVIGIGGAPLGREVAEQFAAVFPNVEIVQGYGLTESSGAVAATVGPEESKMYGSVGKLASHLQAKIVDPSTGEELGPGQRGELWVRGPIVMKGYVGDDEATAATVDSEGWLKTGDLCYFNEDGFLYIVDRLKELIKYKGYQVPPAELEHILQSHPEIVDAAVIPYPDEEAGQLPMAFIVRQPNSNITKEQVMDYVAKHVAPYKKVRRVAFVPTITKSPAGKILRRELVQQALSMGASKL
uniref:4-coumarate--CoA ligase n=1 Tax=Oryza brachyantha TaxID=4533 RepID=J3L6U2_ORYBR